MSFVRGKVRCCCYTVTQNESSLGREEVTTAVLVALRRLGPRMDQILGPQKDFAVGKQVVSDGKGMCC
jgi:hypothetical protein